MWFDTHCHLDFSPFIEQLPQQLEALVSAGVAACFVPAVGPHNWQKVLQLSQYSEVLVGLAYHPCFISEAHLAGEPQQLGDELELLAQLVAQHRHLLSAWGECGLDGRFTEQLLHQRFLFSQQINLAEAAALPLVVHSVRLHDQVAQLLKQQHFTQGGVIHAFSGSYQQAKNFVDLGFKIGVGGTITWPRAEKTRKALRRLPLDALVLETDAPDMPLYQMETASNTPLHLPRIFQQLSALRSETPEQLQQALWDNSCRVFGLID